MFERCVRGAKVYGEYGMGASTIWALGHTAARILAVDTAKQWVSAVQTQVKGDSRLDAVWVDLGPVEDWGVPASFSERARFPAYVESIWRREQKPDVVLIDGRFRVCCFLQSLLEAVPGTQIIFDDYSDRRHFHVVEEFLKPVETCGRQARFVVPEKIDRTALSAERDRFLYVMG